MRGDPRARVLLVSGHLRDAEAQRLLAPGGFADWKAAEGCLKRMATGPQETLALAGLLPHLLSALAGAAGPDGVLVSLERFAQSTEAPLALFRHLRDHPRSVEILVTLFSGSQFLTEILLRHPETFSRLAEPRRLSTPKSAARLLLEARAAAAPAASAGEAFDALRRFQRLELLRIGACDLLGLFDLATVTAQLSSLADALVQACLDVAARESRTDPAGFAVIGMGKLGGQELNYSSDIDLVFVARGNATAYWGLGKVLIDALARATAEGFLYRVDMRLRPWGDAGALVSSVEATLSYLEKHARLWEKQALLKARALAGDLEVGAETLRRAEPLLFDASAETVRDAVHAMKQKTERLLRAKGEELSEVKLGEGSIRDVEFVVQYLQLAHGGERPEVRSRTTLDALARLVAAGILTAEEGRVLGEGYVFLRTVEHHLQVMHYRQTHLLPSDARALGELARRLSFQGEGAGERFRLRHREHGAAIRAVYTRHLGGEKMATLAEPRPSSSGPRERDHAARMDPSYTATFDEDEIRRHAQLAEELADDRLVAVDPAVLPDSLHRVTIVSYDFPGELSLICGLLFAHGFSIQQAEAFTYEPVEASPAGSAVPPAASPYRFGGTAFPARRSPARPPSSGNDPRRKTVDVFTVRPLRGAVDPGVWKEVARDLQGLLQLMRDGKRLEARGEIARRAAVTQQAIAGARTPLLPVDIEIDNDASERYTVLRIDAPDTAGFLYELTNALALGNVYIARLTAGSAGSRVRDTLWVTDAAGLKITSEARQRELRFATALIKHFTHLLPRSPDPRLALLHFGELIGQLLVRPDWPSELSSLESPKVLDALAHLLGVSDFLWTDFLRMQHANLFPIVRDAEALASARGKPELAAALEQALGELPTDDWRGVLNAWKDRELFRIDMRQILGLLPEFDAFAEELTDLAEVIVDTAFRRCRDELAAQFGTARSPDGAPCPVAVCALGKCGGREMGFASDIELVFVTAGDGETDGPQRVTAAELHERLVQAFVGAIRAKREGVFEVDLRLRPYGGAGSMAVSLDAFRRYFARSGPAWAYERQALIRLRPIAGDEALGREVVRLRDELVYDGEPVDVPALRAMRERQVRQIVKGGTFSAKFSPGGLVDVEYLVQALQMRHGHRDERLRAPNTRAAMAALAAAGVLSGTDHARLRKAQTFLRWVVEALRVVRGNARDVTIPPAGSDEFAYLARRMSYAGEPEQLRDEVQRVAASVQELSARLLG